MNGTQIAIRSLTNSGYTFSFVLRYSLLSQNVAGNYSTVRLYTYLVAPVRISWSSGTSYLHNSGWGAIAKEYQGGTHLLRQMDINIAHNNDGSKSQSISAGISTTFVFTGERIITGTITLPNIPRYTNITSYTRSDITMTSFKVNWSASNTVDRVEYRINSGSWTLGQSGDRSSGNFTVSGRNPNTTYQIQIRVRRKSNGLWTDSSNVNVTTTQQNQITSANPIGNSDTELNVTSNSASGSQNDIKLEFPDLALTEILRKNNTLNATFTVAEMESIADYIPNINSTKLRATAVTVVDGVDTYWHYKDGTYTVINANPIFNNFEYEDINPLTLDLTGDNQTIIKGYSNLKATITSANKMEAIKGANPKEYQLVVGSKQAKVDYSDDNDVEMTLNNIDNNVFIVYAIDSRSNSTQKQISPAEYFDYAKPVIGEISVSRENNTSTDTNLSFSGTYLNVNFGSKNNILTATYQYKKTTSEEWIDGNTELTLTIDDNNFSFDGLIAGDLNAEGFTMSESYEIKVVVSDLLESFTSSEVLVSAKPNLAMHKDGVALNGQYDVSKGQGVQVHGKLWLNDEEIGAFDFDKIYPVGYIYHSNSSENPSIKFGGTWVQLTDRFLVGAGGTYANGATGGHANLQSHSHTYSFTSSWADLQGSFLVRSGATANHNIVGGATGIIGTVTNGGASWGNSVSTLATARGADYVSINASHNHSGSGTTSGAGNGNAQNIPPYRGVYMWYRST